MASQDILHRPGREIADRTDGPRRAPGAAFLAHIRLLGAAKATAPAAFWRDLASRVAFRPFS
jgi:hypothetical protein